MRADAVRLKRVYEEEGARLWRAVYLYAADREVASDAVAEAFAQALRRGDDLRSPETVGLADGLPDCGWRTEATEERTWIVDAC